MKKIALIVLFICTLLSFSFSPRTKILAQNISFTNSYVTVVIPFRGRDYWQDFSRVSPLFEYLKISGIPSTVLVQYRNLEDREVINYLKSLPVKVELGLFLEVDKSLADNSKASYIEGIGDRAHSNIILLSGYDVSERKRMIDESFNKFRKILGYYPKSVGGWYIDALSQNYLKEKYQIKALLEVSDQYQTDTYGLWGQPWSVAFAPSKLNPLLPVSDDNNDSGLVKLQWAARDPVGGYGLKVDNSTYSVQANDYIKGHRLDINYFSHLANIYLSPENLPAHRSLGEGRNPVNQLTVGLEAGQEGYQFFDELKRQIRVLSSFSFVTMGEFERIYREKITYPRSSVVTDKSFYWFNFPLYRTLLSLENNDLFLKDLRVYDKSFFYPDLFFKDEEKNLKRIVPFCLDDARLKNKLNLVSEVDSVSLVKQDNNFTLNLKSKSAKNYRLLLTSDGIYLDGLEIFSVKTNLFKSNYLIANFLNLLLRFQTDRNSSLTVQPLFSKIDSVYYFGLPIYPDKLLGVKARYPFFGIFNFPYQVLSKFKSINFDKIFFSFIYSFNNSDINCEATYRTPI